MNTQINENVHKNKILWNHVRLELFSKVIGPHDTC